MQCSATPDDMPPHPAPPRPAPARPERNYYPLVGARHFCSSSAAREKLARLDDSRTGTVPRGAALRRKASRCNYSSTSRRDALHPAGRGAGLASNPIYDKGRKQ